MSKLSFRIFAHSWTSDWNHGNAHFLRGLAYELTKLGHDVRCYEEVNSWSRAHLESEGSDVALAAVQQFYRAFAGLSVRFFTLDDSFEEYAAGELREADVVLVHEWSSPKLVRTILDLKVKLGFKALFHDTHHRAYTNPNDIKQLNVDQFDGVLAFGEAIRRIYMHAFAIQKVWTFHEAADTAHFQPRLQVAENDVIWVGNWGDEERTRELEEFLIAPAERLRTARVMVRGVRYPQQAVERLSQAGIEYGGYLPNLETPQAYASSLLALHVPRKFYANGLSGVPTIRVFEALSCGIPLLCAPWTDTEGLFTAGLDYLVLPDGKSMESEIRRLLRDDNARREIADHGLKTIRQKHTCAHRACQLTNICEDLAR
jgi:spore maturation protein CgeB